MTPIRALTLTLIVVAALALQAKPPEIGWHSAPETAYAVARGQNKLLLVYYRRDCMKCNASMDALLEKAAEDDVFMHVLDAYLPLRVTAGPTQPKHPLVDDLAKLPFAPALVIYDSSGAQISILDRKLRWDGVMEELLRFRGERPRIIRATELRVAGQVPEADLLLGTALLNSREVRAAAYWLDRSM